MIFEARDKELNVFVFDPVFSIRVVPDQRGLFLKNVKRYKPKFFTRNEHRIQDCRVKFYHDLINNFFGYSGYQRDGSYAIFSYILTFNVGTTKGSRILILSLDLTSQEPSRFLLVCFVK